MRTLLFAAAFAAVSTCAHAADLKAAPLPTKAPLPPVYDPYTGIYAGGFIGYGWDRGTLGAAFPGGPADFGDLSNSPQGVMGGGYLGIGTRIPGLLGGLGLDGFAGAEIMGGIGNLSGTAANPGMLTGSVSNTNDRWFAREVARFGLIYQNVLFWGDAGYAEGATKLDVTMGVPNPVVPVGTSIGSNTKTEGGFTWGGGVEFPWFFGPAWKARFQYIQMDFGTNAACILTTCSTTGALPLLVTQKNRVDAVLAGLSLKLN